MCIIITTIIIIAFPLISVSILQSGCRRTLVGWQAPRTRIKLCKNRPAAKLAFGRLEISHWGRCSRASTHKTLDNNGNFQASKTNHLFKHQKVRTTPRLKRFANLMHPWTVPKTPWSLRRALSGLVFRGLGSIGVYD